MQELAHLTAAEAARRIAAGELRSTELVAALIAQISAREPEVQAFAHFDPDQAMEGAKAADLTREKGEPVGALHGVPVALKDIIDTATMPTENGTPLHAGRRPVADAAVVARLREAGAVILGKTVTAELAVLHPGKTRNPANPAHTPGGSSSGSAAAVAAHMAPAALGTQTNGSVIRPAAFCGAHALKPTFGLISRWGVLEEAPSLDTIGVFARSVEDLALLTDCLAGFDPRDPDMRPAPRAPMRPIAMSEPPIPPLFAFIKTPVWEKASAATVDAFAELAETLGAQCREVELPAAFNHVYEMQRVVMLSELAVSYGRLYDAGSSQMSAVLRGLIEEGRRYAAGDYIRARRAQEALWPVLAEVFENFDAILTPAAPGPAPAGLDATGDPSFCTLWTYFGAPALNLPLFAVDGLPMGAQLVGARGEDARLMRTARWLERFAETGS
ncbi:MAG: amidase [Hyphomicrobiales bacterium]|nr:amidase [Hyphomicrobiales bacterium]